MSAPEDLKDVYVDELKDLWSANDQMQSVVETMAGKASDPKLKALLTKSLEGIAKHADAIKTLIASHDDEVTKEHCKGMEGLAKEAKKHAIDEKIADGDVRDVVIVAQYQRLTHYGIAGFGTAAAYAEALGLTKDIKTLNTITKEIYGGDEYATLLAEQTVNGRKMTIAPPVLMTRAPGAHRSAPRSRRAIRCRVTITAGTIECDVGR